MMTKSELEQRIIDEDIPKMYYSLKGGMPGDLYCLGLNNGKWEVYYSERANKNELQIFDNESEACDYFYYWLIEGLTDEGILD